MSAPRRSAPARLLGLALLLVCTACATAPAAAGSFRAEGVVVRHVRIRVAPAHTRAFEELIEGCVASARAAGLPDTHGWLCYHEPPGRYWLLWSADAADALPFPDEPDALTGFVRAVSAAAGERALADAEASLARIEHVVEWSTLNRKKSAWSTVAGVATATHTCARLMVRTVRRGREADFERALTARTAFLEAHDYPLPIEGFVTLSGLPGTALQVVFPRDWPSFHGDESFGRFVEGLDEAARAEYAAVKQALMETMASAEYHDARFEPELSHVLSGPAW